MKNKISNRSVKPKVSFQKYINFLEKYSVLIILILALIAYGQTIKFGLVYCDDFEIIQKEFSKFSSVEHFDEQIFSGYMNSNYYRPIVNLSFLLDAQISGQHPISYHITNLILHIISSILVLLLLKIFTKKNSAALLLGALFTVHPLIINAVGWIVGRNDIIYGIFLFSSALCLITSEDRAKAIYYPLHILFYLLAILSKETAIIFIIISFSYILLLKKEKYKQKDIMALGAGYVTSILFWYFLRMNANLGKKAYSEGFYLLDNIRTIPEFISKFFLPVNLSVLPTYSLYSTISGLILILLLAIFIYFKKNRNIKLIVFGIIWFLVLTLPGMLVTTPDVHEWNEYLECRAYVPSFGLLIILWQLFPEDFFLKYIKKTYIVFAAIVAVFLLLTIYFSGSYSNSRNFYENAVSRSPQKAKFHYLLSKIYQKSKEFSKAENELKLSIDCSPLYSKYPMNLGNFYLEHKQYKNAETYLTRAIQLDSNYLIAYPYLISALEYNGKDALAESILQNMIIRGKFTDDMYFSLLHVFINQKKYDSLSKYADSFLRYKKNKQVLTNFFLTVGSEYFSRKNNETALLLWNKAVFLDPSNVEAWDNLFRFHWTVDIDYPEAAKAADKLRIFGVKINPEILKQLENYRK